jgi:hypothetical protein
MQERFLKEAAGRDHGADETLGRDGNNEAPVR